MNIEQLYKISIVLKEKFNNQYNVRINKDNVMVFYENLSGELREFEISIDELLKEYESISLKKEDVNDDNPLGGNINNKKMQEVIDSAPPKEITYEDIVWDGISRVRVWEGAGKKRLYFTVVGVSDSLHKRGKVFLELVMGKWIPNMKYSLMVSFANQLNELELDDAEMVQELYHQYLDMY